jgi:hypothetical protein
MGQLQMVSNAIEEKHIQYEKGDSPERKDDELTMGMPVKT